MGVMFLATDVLLNGVFWVHSILELTVCELSEVKSEGVCSSSLVDWSAGWISDIQWSVCVPKCHLLMSWISYCCVMYHTVQEAQTKC